MVSSLQAEQKTIIYETKDEVFLIPVFVQEHINSGHSLKDDAANALINVGIDLHSLIKALNNKKVGNANDALLLLKKETGASSGDITASINNFKNKKTSASLKCEFLLDKENSTLVPFIKDAAFLPNDVKYDETVLAALHGGKLRTIANEFSGILLKNNVASMQENKQVDFDVNMARGNYKDEPVIASFQLPNRLDNTEPEVEDDGTPFGLQEFNIRMANSEGRREAAQILLKKMYAWRGYDIGPKETTFPNLITLTADNNGDTVGTMTVCFDNELGLPADETFHEELELLRKQSRQLCEPTRLAVEKDTPKRVLAALWHISYIYCHKIHQYTDYIIEVNPRHAFFYKRMLGFKEFGTERLCARVNAPAVLLRLECQYIASQVERYGGLFEKSARERSFYPFCFPTNDEIGIHARLVTGRT